jgi:putative ABC transport system ATP-binding protein
MTPALRGLTISGSAGESIAVLGPSGCGKSTLLHCLAGLQAPDSGNVSFDGLDLYNLSEARRSEVRLRHFGFVFQTSELISEFSLQENVALPVELLGESRKTALRRAAELLDRLGIGECGDRIPAKVSGGQRQRAAIARAVAARPSVIFADEPTGALDSENRNLVLKLLIEVSREVGSLMVLVTHDDTVAALLDREVRLADGQLAQAGVQVR